MAKTTGEYVVTLERRGVDPKRWGFNLNVAWPNDRKELATQLGATLVATMEMDLQERAGRPVEEAELFEA